MTPGTNNLTGAYDSLELDLLIGTANVATAPGWGGYWESYDDTATWSYHLNTIPPVVIINPSCVLPVNSCLTANGGCDVHGLCTVTGDGANTCACAPGYLGGGQAGDCAVIDNCAIGAHGCDADATCTFTGPATNTCACNPGFSGDGTAGHCTATGSYPATHLEFSPTPTTPNQLALPGDARSYGWAVPESIAVNAVTFQARRVGPVTGALNLRIQENNGGQPGSVIATSTNTLDLATLGTSYAGATFSFATGVPLVAGSTYWFTVGFAVPGTNNLNGSYDALEVDLLIGTPASSSPGWGPYRESYDDAASWAYAHANIPPVIVLNP